jgi:hypothetical protein
MEKYVCSAFLAHSFHAKAPYSWCKQVAALIDGAWSAEGI